MPAHILANVYWLDQDQQRLEARCTGLDDGNGSSLLPPPCTYSGQLIITAGLPNESTIAINTKLENFTNLSNSSGGVLGGEKTTFDAKLELTLSGSGNLAGFSRNLVIPVSGELHFGNRLRNEPIQHIDTELFSLHGSLNGDPDFDTLSISMGRAYDLPGAGNSSLYKRSDGNWNIISSLEVIHRIDFEGASGSSLEGLSGSSSNITVPSLANFEILYKNWLKAEADQAIEELDKIKAQNMFIEIFNQITQTEEEDY